MRKPRRREYLHRGCTQILSKLIFAEPSANSTGYSWTLAAALGEMLLLAEEKFGPRDTSWTILGIDFVNDYSKSWTSGNCKQIIIQLQKAALLNRQYAYNELAHECIHLIAPTGKDDANVLEEGLAEYFAQWYTHYIFGEGWWMTDDHVLPSYAAAHNLVKQLLSLDADIIKKFREVQPVISYITEEQMTDRCPIVPRELACELAKTFVW